MTTTPARAVWLLDVDGVVNVNRPAWPGSPHHAHIPAYGLDHRMRWAPGVLDAIRTFRIVYGTDVRWCTSWAAYARELEHAMRLPELPVALDLNACTTTPATRRAKRAAALAVVDEGRPLVWTDDDAIPADGPDRERLDQAGALLIAPDHRRGLTPDHVDTISRYLSNHNRRPVEVKFQ